MELVKKGFDCKADYFYFNREEDDRISQLFDSNSLLNKFISEINSKMRIGFEVASTKELAKRRDKMNGAYQYIPNTSPYVFMQYLSAVTYLKQYYETKNIKFLDAGCGIGNILAMINFIQQTLCINTIYTGLELDPALAAFGNTFLGFPEWYTGENKPIIEQDITTYTGYTKHNIIYYYCPIANATFEDYFEEYLEDECAVGTIILPNMKRGRAIHEDYRFKKLVVDVEDYNTLIEMFVKIKEGPRKRSIINDISIFELSKDAQKRVKSHIKNVKTGDV